MPLVTGAQATPCRETETVVERGREFLQEGMGYAEAKRAAVQSAVVGAIQTVNPSGYTTVISGRFSGEADSSGHSRQAQSMARSEYQRIRGLATSVRVTNEELKALAGMKVLEVTVEASVCVADRENPEVVILVQDIVWVDGTVSTSLLADVVANFPLQKNVVVLGERQSSTYGDVVMSGRVEDIDFRSLVKTPQKKSAWFADEGSRYETPVRHGQRLAPDQKEIMEIVAKVRINARILASHQVVEVHKVLATEIAVTDDPNWNRNRQHEAKKMVQVAFKMANRELLERLAKLN